MVLASLLEADPMRLIVLGYVAEREVWWLVGCRWSASS